VNGSTIPLLVGVVSKGMEIGKLYENENVI
jgi:hypothetical protein